MNDFLHSLRTGKDKRYDRTRRGHDQSQYRTGDRHAGNDRRKRTNYSKSNIAENAYVTIAKLLPSVKTLLETVVSGQKDYREAQERQAAAMESIAMSLRKIAGEDMAAPHVNAQQERALEEPAGTIESDVSEHTQTIVEMDAIEMMKKLRDQGLSYDKIARQLEDENISTPSGRGKWRGQTVSKLLKSV